VADRAQSGFYAMSHCFSKHYLALNDIVQELFMSGRITRSFIDEVIRRTDIVELIGHHVKLRKAGQNYVACCPFHQEKTPSFSVSPSKQFYHCFGCGVHGTAITFLMEYSQLSFVEAIQELASQNRLAIEYEQHDATYLPRQTAKPKDESLYELLENINHYYQQQLRQPTGKVAVEYLKGRGLTGIVAKNFGLGYAPSGWDTLLKQFSHSDEQRNKLLELGMIVKNDQGRIYDRFRNRVMFPIHDSRGRVIAFGGRVLDESKPKYLNSPETPLFYKGRELYAWHQVRKIRDLQQVVLVEGYMDVVALAQFGVNNAVATLGTAASADHLTQLFRRIDTIVFCFDGDTAGRKAAWRALQIGLPLLQDGRQLQFMFLPEGDDPDSLVRREQASGFHARLQKSQPLSQFLFDSLTQQVHLHTDEGRAKLVEIARPLLELLPQGAYYNLLLQKLSDLSRVELEKLATIIRRDSVTHSATIPTPPVVSAPRLASVQKLPQPLQKNGLVYTIIQYILHKPSLAQVLDPTDSLLMQLTLPGISLLQRVLAIVRQQEASNLALLWEHWRDTEEEQVLDDLLMKKNLWSEKTFDIEQEFNDAVQRLYVHYETQRLAALSEKLAWLTDAEKAEFRQLLMRKQQRR